ncbi:hypothetical protein BBJ28_00026957, partial [Nothophytophthora sp. Chile5]
MLNSWIAAVCFAVLGSAARGGTSFVAADEWDDQADAIVANFSLHDIIGQMTQLAIYQVMTEDMELDEDIVRANAKMGVGSYLGAPLSTGYATIINGTYAWTAERFRSVISRIQEITMEENGGHPIVYGLDSVHGAGYLMDTVIFGHQINGGASFNPDLVYEMGRVTGRDTLAAGAPWVFSPMLEVSQNLLWSRTFESFGEDPHLVSVMADAVVRGIQSNNNTAACMKHFIAYSKTPSGHDKDGVTISDFDLLNYFVPPFKAAIGAGAMTVMENYISVNGVPVVENAKLLKKLLRHDLGFNGVATTDYN